MHETWGRLGWNEVAYGVGGRGWKFGGQGLFLMSGGFGYIRELPMCGSLETVEIYA